MKYTRYFALLSCLVANFNLLAQTNVSGNQNGTWLASPGPYTITENIAIPTGQTLTIEPGTLVQFPTANSQITVQRALKAGHCFQLYSI